LDGGLDVDIGKSVNSLVGDGDLGGVERFEGDWKGKGIRQISVDCVAGNRVFIQAGAGSGSDRPLLARRCDQDVG
jgi:hypothetical protein